MPFDPVSLHFWEAKYQLRAPDGSPIDTRIEDTWRRVARALAAAEMPDRRKWWANAFYDAMEGFKFIPAGRIVSGAGTGRDVTLHNCYVMGAIEDSMEGIFQALKEAALTLRQGGGVGMDFSTIRPRGSLVSGIGSRAHGPLDFMDVWDSMARTMQDAKDRVAAMMGVMRCDHPDIEEFITAKQTRGRLTQFNLSVLVTDAFMLAVADDLDWPLIFGGAAHRVVRARELWDKLMRATYAYAEPGVIFIDRVNRENNLWYCEEISATNPCFSGTTRLLTTIGYRTMMELWEAGGRQEYDGTPSIEKHGALAIVNDRGPAMATNAYRTSRSAPLYRVSLDNGQFLDVTSTHRFVVLDEDGREGTATTADLMPGNRLPLGVQDVFGDYHDPNYALLAGWVIGDGVISREGDGQVRATVTCYQGDIVDVMPAMHDAMDGLCRRLSITAHMSPRAENPWGYEPRGFNHREARITSRVLGRVMSEDGVIPGDKHRVPASIWRGDEATVAAFLRALFSADGSVQVNNVRKCMSVRLAQNNQSFLRDCHLLLGQFGITSTVLLRRVAGTQMMSDGRGGRKMYNKAANYELIVSGRTNVEEFQRRIGFIQDRQNQKAAAWLAAHAGSGNSAVRRYRKVTSVEYVGVGATYCLTEPQSSRVIANGITTLNCGEEPLPPYGACLLGSINLAALVSDPFTPRARIEPRRLADLVPVAVRMLDNVIDVSGHPLPEQQAEAVAKRRLGLGVTGLADALVMCDARYGSAEAVALTTEWLSSIEVGAYLASAALAAEKGPFPAYASSYVDGERFRRLPNDVRERVRAVGIRNSHLMAVAPTGTISLLAGNVSGGVEPIFALTYRRRVRQPDGSYREEDMDDYAYRLWRRLRGDEPIAAAFVTAQELTWGEHVVMLAAVQARVDTSVSKTINLPRDIPFEEFRDVYVTAYASGCKSCTTYRPNDVTGAVLVVDDGAPAAAPPAPSFAEPRLRQRPDVLSGRTYRVRWAGISSYITVNDEVMGDGSHVPFEVLITSQAVDSAHWISALTRTISAVMRREGDFRFLPGELMRVWSARGGEFVGGRWVGSEVALFGATLRRHFIDVGYMEDDAAIPGAPTAASTTTGFAELGSQCPNPDCGQPTLIRVEGCDKCLSCGYTHCG